MLAPFNEFVGPLLKVKIGYSIAWSLVIIVPSFYVRNKFVWQFFKFEAYNDNLKPFITLLASGLKQALKIEAPSLSNNPIYAILCDNV